MKGIIHLIALLFPVIPLFSQNIAIQEVLYNQSTGNDKFELVNTTNTTINISTWWMCARFNYRQFSDVTSIEVLEGSLNMPPMSSVKLRIIDYDMHNSHSDFAIYTSAANFADPDLMHDFIQYGDDVEVGRGSVAVEKGIWRDMDPGAGFSLDFIPTAPAGQSTHFDGSNGGGGELTFATDFNNGPQGLPVQLLTLSATVNINQEVELRWIALDEIYSLKHLVEKSNDGETYTVVAEIPSLNLGTTPGHYTYLDQSPFLNVINYYRIRQIDYDGGEFLSTPLYVMVKDVAQHDLFISPMPISGISCFSIEFYWPKEEFGLFRIMDMNGKEAEVFKEPLLEGYNNIMHQFHGLLPGQYILLITNDEGHYAAKEFVIGTY